MGEGAGSKEPRRRVTLMSSLTIEAQIRRDIQE